MLTCYRYWPRWRQTQHWRDRGHWWAVYSQEEEVCQGGMARCCQVLSSEEKTIELFNHIVHHYFNAKWDIVFQGESRGRRKDCFEKGSQVQFCIEMSNLQNCVEIIAFEMSLNDELLLKYRHVNLRSLQLGPPTMLKRLSDRNYLSPQMDQCKALYTVVLRHFCLAPINWMVKSPKFPNFRADLSFLRMASCAPFGLHAGLRKWNGEIFKTG